MAKTIGLFTRTELIQGVKPRGKKATQDDTTAEEFWKIGLEGVRDMNPGAFCPFMEPSGSPTPDVYILGEAPGEEEDLKGEPFVGKSGKLLRQFIPGRFEKKIRMNNCVRTRPIDNATPDFRQVECFRPSVRADIVASRPKVVIGAGNLPTKWMLGKDAPPVGVCRGRMFPVWLDGHSFWFYPVVHPSALLRQRDDSGERLFGKDMAKAFSIATFEEPPEIVDTSNLLQGVHIATELGVEETIRMLDEMHEAKQVGVDLETYPFRPYNAGDGVLSAALGTYRRTVAVPINHPKNPFKGRDKERIEKAVFDVINDTRVAKVAHNTAFELEWFIKMYGPKVVFAQTWHDTMSQAYILDERVGGFSLDFLCLQHFGIHLKIFSDVNREKLNIEDLNKVLRYNGGDTKWTEPLFRRQRQDLEDQNLLQAYEFQRRRLFPLALAQSKGMRVDLSLVKELQADLQKQIDETNKIIFSLPDVRRFESHNGPFNPGSNPQLAKLLKAMGRTEGLDPETGKFSVDEETLEQIDTELTRQIVVLRKITKLKSTYVDPLNSEERRTIIHDDGRIHCIFKSTFVSTGRLSSEDPNMQNFPKREAQSRKVRKLIVPDEGHILVAADYAQLEARVIAMFSKDKVLTEAIWNDYDVHMDWAQRVVDVFPQVFEERYGDVQDHKKAMKAFRGDIKNQLVFPAFYGSHPRSIGRNLGGMPESIYQPLFDDFWSMFAGVKAWQKNLLNHYRDNFWSACLTGRRRRYGDPKVGFPPMTSNMTINSPVQGTASDIVVESMTALAEAAVQEDKPWLAACLNIHDDLTFSVPIEKKEEAIDRIVKEMTKVRFRWVSVPLGIEVSVGPNWLEMEEIGKYRSDVVWKDAA